MSSALLLPQKVDIIDFRQMFGNGPQAVISQQVI